MRLCSFLIVVACLAASAHADEKFTIDDAHAVIRFTATLGGMTDVEGRFNETDAAITYDEADLTKSSVTAFIKIASVDTGEGERDKHLQTADFFDAQKFPYMVFRSKRIEKRGDAWQVVGDLTIHGVTKEVALPFQWKHKKAIDVFGNDRIGFEAQTTIKRSDYGITGPQFWGSAISDEVNIVLKVSARIYNFDHIDASGRNGKKAFVKELLPLFERDVTSGSKRLGEIEGLPNEYDLREGLYNNLGRKLYQHGKIEAALAVFKEYSRIFPASPTAMEGLADAYLAVGQKAEAAAAYRKSLELEPTNASAAENLRYLPSSAPSANR